MVYHATTRKKIKKYEETGVILPPVRYWTTKYSAMKWMKRVGRNILIGFQEPKESYPLPIKGGAKWSPEIIRNWEVITQ